MATQDKNICIDILYEKLNLNKYSTMIKYIKFRLKLNRLFKEREKTKKLYSKTQKEIKRNNSSHDERESLIHQEISELNIIDYEIESLSTSYYIDMAKMKFIEIPPFHDKKSWVTSSLDPNV